MKDAGCRHETARAGKANRAGTNPSPRAPQGSVRRGPGPDVARDEIPRDNPVPARDGRAMLPPRRSTRELVARVGDRVAAKARMADSA